MVPSYRTVAVAFRYTDDPMRPNERAEFLRAWQQVASGLAAISALLDELPETMRPELLKLLHKLKSSQLRRYHQVEQLPPAPVGGPTLVGDAIEQQLVLAREVANFIDHARDECTRAGARRSTALVPAAARRGDWNNHDSRAFRHEVSATLDELQSAGRSTAGRVQPLPAHYRQATTAMPSPPLAATTALCGMCHQPVQAVYMAPLPPPQMRLLGAPVRSTAGGEEAELDEDVRHPRRRGAKASGRRRDATESLVSSVVKAIGGTGMLLAVAVIVTSIAFRSTRPTSQPIAHEQHDVDDARMAAVDTARPTSGAQEKPFVDRLELVPTNVAGAAAQAPRVAPAPAPIAAAHDGMAVRASPASPAKSMEPVSTLAADQTEWFDRDAKQQRLKAKAVTRVAATQAVGAYSPAPEKVAAAPVQRPPVNVMRAEAKPSAAEDTDTGDGLYVAVLSTHKEASAARDEFAELQRKYAVILGSKQSEVQVMTGQTGSWHRLVATPASTKAAANQICNDLRSAGYGRCWVKAY